jgi:hypothetical protein
MKTNLRKILENNQGIALLMVMTSIAMLAIILAEFTFESKLNKIKSTNDQNRAQAKLLAEAGLNFAMAKLKIYQEAKNLLENNPDYKDMIKPQLIENVILMPFIYPLPEDPKADLIVKTTIADFSKSIILDGELNVSVTPVTGFYNVNALRVAPKAGDGSELTDNGETDTELDPSNDTNSEKDFLPHQFIEKELVKTLTTSMEDKRQKDEEFDALYGHLQPELLIKELKFFVTDRDKYKDSDIGDIQGRYAELGIEPKYSALSSKEELYGLAGWPDAIVDLIIDRISVQQNTVVYVDKLTATQLKSLFPELAAEQIEEYFKIINGSEQNGSLPVEIKSVEDFKNVLTGQMAVISPADFDERAAEFAKAGIQLGLDGKLFKVSSVGTYQNSVYTLEIIIDIPIKETKIASTDAQNPGAEGEEQQPVAEGTTSSNPSEDGKKKKVKKEYLNPKIVEIIIN